MTGIELLASCAGVAFVGVAGLAIIPNPLRQSVRDMLNIFGKRGIEASTTEIERVNQRVTVLAAQIKENERKTSDLRGTLNAQKNKLGGLQGALKKAEDDYKLAQDQKLGEATEHDCLDKIGAAEEAMHQQESLVDDIQKTVDVTRLAVAKAAGELQKLQSKVTTAEARVVATNAIGSASAVLESTKDMAKATSGMGKDLDAIDEKYEQAKARLEDAQGSESERKLEEARKNKERDDIKKRMDERRNAETGAASK